MSLINVKVVSISGETIYYATILRDTFINQLYNELYRLFYNCSQIYLLYLGKKISPLTKISQLTIITDLLIILDIVIIESDCSLWQSYTDIDIAICSKNKIIHRQFLPRVDDELFNFYYFCNFYNFYNYKKYEEIFLTKDYNCLSIVSICDNELNIGILFENGIGIILSSCDNPIIINTFHNVTKIVAAYNLIGIIINDNKLIIYYNTKGIFVDSPDLNNLDYNNIYVDANNFFIVGKQFLTIVKSSMYNPENPLIFKYEIQNIDTLHIFSESYLDVTYYYIYIINIDKTLILLKLKDELTTMTVFKDEDKDEDEDENININEQLLKIKKILSIDRTIIFLTYDDIVIICGNNKWLIKCYNLLKNDLGDVEDIVVTSTSLGILKKNNSIIIITINGLYTIYTDTCHETIVSENFYIFERKLDLEYQYVKIISNQYIICALADNNKVYLISEPKNKYDLPTTIELFNNIKKLYANVKDIIAISYENIVYAYRYYKEYNPHIYYEQQFSDLKSIKINAHNFVIIKNDNNLIEIYYISELNQITVSSLTNVSKFIRIYKN